MAKVLVTGANGFLGSWLTKALLEAGHETVALVRKNSDTSELDTKNCSLSYGDITEPDSLKRALVGVETVFHLAGLIAYRKADRPLMEKVNVEGTNNIVNAVGSSSVQRLVHLSSVVAVGASFSDKGVLTETATYNLGHLNLGYFETKRKAEQIVVEACKAKMIDAVILNPSTIYGSGDAKKGSRKTQVKVAQGRFPFYTSGGVNVVAVEDVVAGIISAWLKGRTGERYILSGENLYIKDLFAIIAKCAGVSAPNLLLPNSLLHALGIMGDFLNSINLKGPISRENAWTATLFHWFDSSKAQAELDFRPQKAEISIAKSVSWMRDNGYLGER